MGKNLEASINENSESFYKLYLLGRQEGLGNNILSFLLLTAVEEKSKYFMEILMRKCGSPSIRRKVRAIIYVNHVIKYKFYIALYCMITPSYYDINYIRHKAESLSDKWKKMRNQYLINISRTSINNADIVEIDELYKGSNEIESEIKSLDKEDSCNILNQLLVLLS
ncbi:hypothetical protein [Saccharolobus shibatae]|uniref:Uncharacterized protein n=1 Tax=Saccharolobus shibatae TaxID=2286 RepID=A0A8F5GZ40_9CREN|nr:hypothetical protein [Saccharolobus shibatae]QXJ31915.1 hypothetical protein J5U21_01566 [Saccharolobus shibatae]QXJ34919.1 hypothetical protein J5U22_01466 [Saccharolobus shibatae]